MISIVRIGFKDGRDYPGKQTITMGRVYNLNRTSRVEELARLYNRQSREYKVEILQYDESENYAHSAEVLSVWERKKFMPSCARSPRKIAQKCGFQTHCNY